VAQSCGGLGLSMCVKERTGTRGMCVKERTGMGVACVGEGVGWNERCSSPVCLRCMCMGRVLRLTSGALALVAFYVDGLHRIGIVSARGAHKHKVLHLSLRHGAGAWALVMLESAAV
jgi:hypothetical protein